MTNQETDFSEKQVPHHFIQGVPQQPKDSNDCGAYVLGFIERFIKQPLESENDSVQSWETYPYHLVRRRIYEDIKTVCSEEQKRKLRPIDF